MNGHTTPPEIETTTTFPSSIGQEEMWLFDQKQSGAMGLHLVGVVNIEGPLRVELLERAARNVHALRDELRMVFEWRDSGLFARIVDSQPAQWEYTDLGATKEPERAEADRASRHRTIDAPYDFQRGPLMRLCLQRLDRNRHRLIAASHHLICDGRAALFLVEEWVLNYAALIDGQPLEPRHVRPFAQFAANQREAARGEEANVSRAYWQKTLNGLTAPSWPVSADTDGTADAASGEDWRPRGELRTFVLDAEITARFDDFCSAERLSIFEVFLSIWLLLLHRVCAQKDLAVGVPVDLRPRGTTDLFLGPYLNTMAIRSALDERAAVREWFRETASRVRSAFRHRKLPFLEVVRAVQHGRSVRAGFTLLDPVPAPVERGGCVWQVAPETLDGTSEFGFLFDVHLVVRRSGDQYNCGIRYDTRQIRRELAATMERGLLTLMESVLHDPGRQIASLDWTPAAERRELLTLGAGPRVERVAGSIDGRIAIQAQRTPHAIAVTDDVVEWSYGELEARANAVAGTVKSAGVAPGSRVGIAVPRSALQIAAILGVLKAGASFVPIDSDLPPQRIEEILSDAALSALLATPDQAFPTTDGTTALPLTLDGLQYGGTVHPSHSDDGLAYWIYTSGSTGQPKAAGNTHRAVLNRLEWGVKHFGLDESDRVLYKTPLTFDVAVSEFLPPLMTGARVVVAAPNEHRDLRQLLVRIEREAITELHFVPSVFVRFLELLDGGHSLPALRRVLLTGEAVVPALIQRASRLLDAEIYNMYGPVEAAIEVTHHRCRSDQEKTVPIGRPIDNVRVYLLDAGGRLVPRGLPGEIYLGGACVASGYLHRPELTEERFISDVFDDDSRGMMYRTGDLGRWNDQGCLEFIGRRDHQIKLHGVRIELGEIENALARCPGVREAIAAVQKNTAGQPVLIGYVTPDGLDAESLLDLLRATLPQAMIPAAIESLACFPLNANGKVDRAALPAPDVCARKGIPLEPGIQQFIADAWSRSLGVPVRFADDNFFELGGDSLDALEAQFVLESEYALTTDLAGFLGAPTVRALAARLSADERPYSLQLRSVRTEGSLCVSARQRRLVRSALRNRANFLDHLIVPLQLKGALEIDALRSAFRDVLAVHNAPRAVFEEDAKGAVSARLLPVDMFDVDVAFVDDEAAVVTGAIDKAASMDRAGFELDGPLFRAVLFTSGGSFHAFLLCAHHAVIDGWSIGPFTRSLAGAYEARRADRLPNLRQPAYQYWDFAAADAEFHRREEARRRLSFWEGALKDHPWKTHPSVPDRPFKGALHAARLDDGFGSKLSGIVRFNAVTRLTFFLTAFARAVAAVEGSGDVLVSVTQMNRERAGLDAVVGYFVNQLPVRFSVPPGPVSPRKDLERMRDALAEARANALSCDYLVEHLWPGLYFERFLPARFSLNVIPDPMSKQSLADVDASFASGWVEAPAFLYFDVMLFVNPDTLALDLVYDRERFGDENGVRLLEEFRENLDRLAEGAF